MSSPTGRIANFLRLHPIATVLSAVIFVSLFTTVFCLSIATNFARKETASNLSSQNRDSTGAASGNSSSTQTNTKATSDSGAPPTREQLEMLDRKLEKLEEVVSSFEKVDEDFRSKLKESDNRIAAQISGFGTDSPLAKSSRELWATQRAVTVARWKEKIAYDSNKLKRDADEYTESRKLKGTKEGEYFERGVSKLIARFSAMLESAF